MLLQDINLNYFRVFMAVYHRRSMTEAAHDLHLTQSGVSQQIKNLEDSLGVDLFDRIHRQLIPRREAELLYQQCVKNLNALEDVLAGFRAPESVELKGTIRVGMPIEFAVNVIAPILSEFGQKHSKVRLVCEIGMATELSGRLVSGDLDIAFFDHFKLDPRIEARPVYSEVLQLCIGPQLKKKLGAFQNNFSYFQSLPFIAYERDFPVLRMWFAHHFSKKKIDLQVRAMAVDVSMVASFIKTGLGAGILPHHFIEKAKSSGTDLHIYKMKRQNLVNEISMGTLRGRHSSIELNALMQFVDKKFEKLN